MVDFVNPGSLGDLRMFTNIYAKAINGLYLIYIYMVNLMKSLSASLNKTTLAGRDRGATPRDKLLSTSRAGEINATTEVKLMMF